MGVSLRDVNLGEGETISKSVQIFSKDRLLSLRKIAVLLHKVAAGKLSLIVTWFQTS